LGPIVSYGKRKECGGKGGGRNYPKRGLDRLLGEMETTDQSIKKQRSAGMRGLKNAMSLGRFNNKGGGRS